MHGVWTALVTPFTDKNKIDFSALKAILLDQVSAGVSGVVPCGTTGESPTLTLEEKKTLIQFTLETLKGSKVQVLVGTGTNHTQESVDFSQWACKQGADGVLIVTPYYNKPSQQGLISHFKAIADAVDCEVMLYNVPGRTGVSLSVDTVVELAAHKRIKSIKEASGNVAFTSELQGALSERHLSLDILSGDDATYFPLLAVGAVGVVSVASNLFPRAMVALQKAMEQGEWISARKIHQSYFPLFKDLFIESNPIPIKVAMAYAGWCRAETRLPLTALSPHAQEQLLMSLKKCAIQPSMNSTFASSGRLE